MRRIAAFLCAVLFLGVTTSARAEVVKLSGTVTTYTDQVGVFGGVDLAGATFAGSMIFSDDPACSTYTPCYEIGPFTVGPFAFTFPWRGVSTLGTYGGTTSFYLLPFQGVTITGPSGEFSGPSAGVFSLNGDGTGTWGLGVMDRNTYSQVVRVAGVASVVTVPEPATLALVGVGLAVVGASRRRR